MVNIKMGKLPFGSERSSFPVWFEVSQNSQIENKNQTKMENLRKEEVITTDEDYSEGKIAQAYRLKNYNDPRNENPFRGRSQQWILQYPFWSRIESQNLPSLPSDCVLSTGLRLRETRHRGHLMTGSTKDRASLETNMMTCIITP